MNTPVFSLFKTTLMTGLITSLPVMSLAATPQKWQLDVPKTNVDFEVPYLGNALATGQFKKVDGTIKYDIKNPTHTSINFTVNTNSIDTGIRLRDSFLRRKELLNTQQYPTMTFVSKKVTMINAQEANVTGDFTVLGQTKPLTVKVTLKEVNTKANAIKPTMGFLATGMINRHTYGVTAFPKMVGNMIAIKISGELIAAH